MYFSEVRYAAAAGVLEGHWITAAPGPLDVITARLAPGCRSFNKEGHQEENNLSVCITLPVCQRISAVKRTAVLFMSVDNERMKYRWTRKMMAKIVS